MQGLKLTHVSKDVTGSKICVYGSRLSRHLTSPPAIPHTELIATECHIIYVKRPSLMGRLMSRAYKQRDVAMNPHTKKTVGSQSKLITSCVYMYNMMLYVTIFVTAQQFQAMFRQFFGRCQNFVLCRELKEVNPWDMIILLTTMQNHRNLTMTHLTYPNCTIHTLMS